jgi:hypothetical protein
MNIRPDRINFLSTLPNYINIGNPTGTIAIGGSIADMSGQSFSVTIPTSTDNTRFDIYGTNQNTNIKQLLSNTGYPVIYQSVSTEDVTSQVTYAPGSITVQINIANNTGAGIILMTQNIAVVVVEYRIPY